MPRLVLASQSPRRSQLLRDAGVAFEVVAVDCDESWLAGEHAVDYARRVALAKAQAAARRLDAALLVLAADTTVWLDGEAVPLGKPRDREDAAAMVRALTGPAGHLVTTAYVLMDTRRHDRATVHTRAEQETTRVFMRPLSEPELAAYLDTSEWQDKAGGYGIQGRAAGWVRRIEGSYTNVVGLPLAQVLEALASLREGDAADRSPAEERR